MRRSSTKFYNISSPKEFPCIPSQSVIAPEVSALLTPWEIFLTNYLIRLESITFRPNYQVTGHTADGGRSYSLDPSPHPLPRGNQWIQSWNSFHLAHLFLQKKSRVWGRKGYEWGAQKFKRQKLEAMCGHLDLGSKNNSPYK